MDTLAAGLTKDIHKGQHPDDDSEMPEKKLPAGMKAGSLEYILFITLSVSIDYQRDADRLWDAARATFEDSETTYLFNPFLLAGKRLEIIVQDMQKHNLSKKPYRDAHTWRAVALSFLKKWQEDPLCFLDACGWDAIEILSRLGRDKHFDGRKEASYFPYLRGRKIGPLWLRMLRDNVGLKKLKNLGRVPIPADIHVARSSLAVGIVRGRFKRHIEPVYQKIREAWAESARGFEYGRREMTALDMDKPLWKLSKFGCAS